MSSTNFLQPTGFKIVIDRKNYHNLEFYIQSVDHPSVSLPSARQPYKRIANVPYAGDTLEFGEVTFNIMLDENLEAYQEMYNWLTRLVQNKRVTSTEAKSQGTLSNSVDISLIILNSSNLKTKEFVYIDCVPTNLGNISFESNTTSAEPIIVPVSFEYSYFKIK